VPPGFAHGFLVLSEVADFLYKTTAYYDPTDEFCLRWDDPQIGVQWPLQGEPNISEKDRRGLPFSQAPCF
jgi:dTDP-4-dehydrorhamnose 3,5-epimerase